MVFIKKVKINGFMSFDDDLEVFLNKKINMTVGTNGTGKTNFLILLSQTLENLNELNIISQHINNSKNNKYIEIHLDLEEYDLSYLNNLYRSFLIKEIFQLYKNISDILDNIVEQLFKIKFFGKK